MKQVERLEDVTDCRGPEVIAVGFAQFGHFDPVQNDGSLVWSKYARQEDEETLFSPNHFRHACRKRSPLADREKLPTSTTRDFLRRQAKQNSCVE